jgi:ABC-type nitrate/sulfonate/bicarbonate transport system permease component
MRFTSGPPAAWGPAKNNLFRIICPGHAFIFTGLQISMGYSWFCLVAGEMIAGEFSWVT